MPINSLRFFKIFKIKYILFIILFKALFVFGHSAETCSKNFESNEISNEILNHFQELKLKVNQRKIALDLQINNYYNEIMNNIQRLEDDSVALSQQIEADQKLAACDQSDGQSSENKEIIENIRNYVFVYNKTDVKQLFGEFGHLTVRFLV